MKKLSFSTLLISFFFLLNCTKKGEEKNYIISKKEKDYRKMFKESRNKLIPPPPPRGPFIYGSNNFIIDKDTNLFYFQRPSFILLCGTGSENDTIPQLMEFKKEDFIQIPKNSIQKFVKLNFKGGDRNFTHIASQIDTLNFKLYFALVNAVRQSTLIRDGDLFIIRRTTQEEDTVIEYKKKGKSYYYRNIKWDTTRIDTVQYKFVKNI